jgi:hypothetical protein
MPSPLPRRDRWRDRVAPLEPTTAAFPTIGLGRLPHCVFRGLLGVHARYGLPARGTAFRSFPSKASAISLPPPPLRLLLAGATVARWESHPLKNNAFARRTQLATTGHVANVRASGGRLLQHGQHSADGHLASDWLFFQFLLSTVYFLRLPRHVGGEWRSTFGSTNPVVHKLYEARRLHRHHRQA